MMEDEIEFLMDIRNSLDSNIVQQKDIENTREKIIKQIEKARVKINEKLKAYLRKIISSNVFHEKSFLEIIEYIDISKPHEIVEKSDSNSTIAGKCATIRQCLNTFLYFQTCKNHVTNTINLV